MANSKLTALSEVTTPTSDDLVYLVNDPAGTPTSNKVTLANIWANISGAIAGTAPLSSKNVADNASVQVAVFEGDRATPTDGDTAYISFRLSDNAGNQDEQARISWSATTVANGATQDGDLHLDGGVTAAAWDDQEDWLMARALRVSVMPEGALLRQQYADTLTRFAPVLRESRIVSEGGMISTKRMQAFQLDALYQLGLWHQSHETRIAALEQELATLKAGLVLQ